MKKSVFTFGLLASSLVMLGITPFLNQNNHFSNVMANMEIVIIARIKQTIKNTNVEQVHLKDFLYLQ